MSTLFRLLIGVGLYSFGYYLGREVGRLEPIRLELERARKRRGLTIEGRAEDSPGERAKT